MNVVTTVSQLTSHDFNELADPDAPSINFDNSKLAGPVVRTINTNTNELVEPSSKACKMDSVTEDCFSNKSFGAIITTDGLSTTSSNA